MSIYKDATEVEVRDRRLHSILTFNGTANELNEKSKNKEFIYKSRYYSQCSDCANGCAETQTLHVRGAAVISHSPIGCSTGSAIQNILHNAVSTARKLEVNKVQMICSNIQEKDTVYGAAEKLKASIYEADRRFKPTVIFIQGSCASGIIGEDLESIANEAEDELGYPVIPVYCEGFKSKVWSSGFDAVFHGILRKIVEEPKKKQTDLVNIFNFEGSNTFEPILSKLNLRTNYLVPLATVEQLKSISEAACTAVVCETLATYVASSLEEKYGVPEVKAPAPFGIDWTDRWIREIAKLTDREELAEKVINEEHLRIQNDLEELKQKLNGKKLYVVTGDSFAHNLGNAAKDFGMKLVGVTTLHHDQNTDSDAQINTLGELIKGNGDINNFSVCNKQPYQVYKIIKKLQPDLVIVRHPNLTTLGTKLGIPTLFEGDANYSIGYDGIIRLGNRFCEALQTKKLVDNIAEDVKLPYSDWWMEQDDPFYFEGGR